MAELEDAHEATLRTAPWLSKQISGKAWLIKYAHVEQEHRAVFLATDLSRCYCEAVSARELHRRLQLEEGDDEAGDNQKAQRRLEGLFTRGDAWDDVSIELEDDAKRYDLNLTLAGENISFPLKMSKINYKQTSEILRDHLLVPLISVVGAFSGLVTEHVERHMFHEDTDSVQEAIDTSASTAAFRLEPLIVSNLASPLVNTALERFVAGKAKRPARGRGNAAAALPEIRLEWPAAPERDSADDRPQARSPEPTKRTQTIQPAKRQRQRSTPISSPARSISPVARQTRNLKQASPSPSPRAEEDAPSHRTRKHDHQRVESPPPDKEDDMPVDGNGDDLDAIVEAVRKRSPGSAAVGEDTAGEDGPPAGDEADHDFDSDMTVDEDDEEAVATFAKRKAARDARRAGAAQGSSTSRAIPASPPQPAPKSTRKRKAESPAPSEAPTTDTKRSGSAAPRTETDRAAALAALRHAGRQTSPAAPSSGKRDKEEQAAIERKREEEVAARMAATSAAARGRGSGRGRGRAVW